MQQTAPLQPAWTPRRIILATLVVVGVCLGFYLLLRFRLVFLSLFVAIVLSTAIEPLVNRLCRWGLPRATSIILVSVGLLLALALFVMAFVPLISEQWATVSSLIGSWYQELRSAMIESNSLIIRRIAHQIPVFLPLTPPPIQPDEAPEDKLEMVQQATTIGMAVLRSLLVILAVGLLTSYWLLEGDRAIRLAMLSLSVSRREKTRLFLEDLKDKVGAYTRGLVILCAIIGLLQTIAYLIIGLPNFLLLGILAGLMEAVPLVGPFLGAVPAFIVAAAFDPSKVIWVVVATIIIQILENNLIVPKVMARAVGVNPVASLLAFIAFSSIFGLVGALLAIPLAAVIQVVLKYFLFKDDNPDSIAPAGRNAVSSLRYEAQNLVMDVRKQIRKKETELDNSADQIEDAMESIVQDLDSILAQAEAQDGGMTRSNTPVNGETRQR
jgi:predicted PurR-regulated permease PerM